MTEPHRPGIRRDLHEVIDDLESRVRRLEQHLELTSPADILTLTGSEPVSVSTTPTSPTDRTGLESRIGEYGLAWIGSAVLLLGIMFSMAYLQSQGSSLLSSLLGFAVVTGLHRIARRWEESVPHLFRVSMISALLLLWYTILRLHFFTESPLIPDTFIGPGLLVAATGYQFWFSLRHEARIQIILALIMGIASALLIDAGWLTLLLITGLAFIAVFNAERQKWPGLVMAAIPLVYTGHLVWLLGNPIAGHGLELRPDGSFGLIFLFLYAILFVRPAYTNPPESSVDLPSITLIIFNCLGFVSLATLSVIAHFPAQYAAVALLGTAFYLAISINLWMRTRLQFAPAMYAGFGFMTLTISIYGFTGIPDAFFWLSLQGLLVVSLALWFRSKILVIGNILIFSTIMLSYLLVSSSSDAVNFSFALVSLASARIMNWQQERLTLHTELMRNLYLLIAFGFMLYAVQQAVPGQMVSLAWTVTAATYFVMSLILRNIKYRAMAIGTMLATVGYLFLIDLARLDPIVRVAAFLFLGVIALSVSMYYTRFRQNHGREEESELIQDP